jgi:hypothetical protein
LQPALFTRLTVVEDELSAVKGMLAELQVSQDELRRDGDEWRWRADEVLDAVTSWFRGVLAGVQNRLSYVKANRGETR